MVLQRNSLVEGTSPVRSAVSAYAGKVPGATNARAAKCRDDGATGGRLISGGWSSSGYRRERRRRRRHSGDRRRSRFLR